MRLFCHIYTYIYTYTNIYIYIYIYDKILSAVHALEDDQQAKRHMMCVMLHRRCVQPFLSVLIIENRLEQASAVGFVCLRVFHDALPAQPSPLFPSHSYHRKAIKATIDGEYHRQRASYRQLNFLFCLPLVPENLGFDETKIKKNHAYSNDDHRHVVTRRWGACQHTHQHLCQFQCLNLRGKYGLGNT